jgi:hypothetical protein
MALIEGANYYETLSLNPMSLMGNDMTCTDGHTSRVQPEDTITS